LLYAQKLAEALVGAGKPTDENISPRIAFLLDPGPEYVACTLGCWRCNCIAFPLATMHPAQELIHYIEDSRCSLIVASDGYKARLTEALAACGSAKPIVIIIEEAGLVAGLLHADGRLPQETSWSSAEPATTPSASDSDGCLLLYTSGTTSKPKGVLHSHRSIAAQVRSLIEAWQWTSSDSTLHCLPLHHIHGIVNILYCALAARARVLFAGKFDAAKVVLSLASGALTVFMAVPTVYHKLLAAIRSMVNPNPQTPTPNPLAPHPTPHTPHPTPQPPNHRHEACTIRAKATMLNTHFRGQRSKVACVQRCNVGCGSWSAGPQVPAFAFGA
jgi:long-subunit acyl-CoA synthetase (AMP-forming)